MVSTTIPVCTPSHSRCRPPESARVPAAGATTAMTKPAAAIDQPRAEEPASSVAATDFVRYGVNTKVMMTALKAAEPQSQSAQRSEEHTSELQSRGHLVCRLLLEKKNTPCNGTDGVRSGQYGA